jgi:hypothetical protein
MLRPFAMNLIALHTWLENFEERETSESPLIAVVAISLIGTP